MSLTYEKIYNRIGFDLDTYFDEKDKKDEKKEWTEDDNDDLYPFNIMTPEEKDFYAEYRMKKLGLV